MPGINRVRIINFSYNNDAREIVDETFDFYDGENVLLNLSNGGGKSVLVQLMMQPILPDLKVQKRKMVDYLTHSTSPVFVILEWILDNPDLKDYLMTGIAIAPKSAMQSEDSNKINYFTFASHYDRACEFDITSLPFARNEGGKRILMPFERSREAVKKLASSHREIFCYSREDGADYRKLLLNFGIAQEEWKNIIARMNNDEGGIDELFERCATSDSVFNEWIIKNIEKAQLAGEAGGTEIEELLAGLVSDTIKNEEYLKAQKTISSYMDRHRQMEESLEEVCRSLEERSKAEKALGSMHQALEKQIMDTQAELSGLELKQKEVEARQLHIRMEEASQQYYEAEQYYKEAAVLTEKMEKKREETSALVKAGRYLLECCQAAKILEECRRLQGRIEGIRGSIDAQNGDLKVKGRMDSLAYSLSVQCGKRCRELEENASKCEEDLRQLEGLLEELKSRESEDGKHLNRLNNQAGVLEAQTGQFEQYEERIFKELGITFLRNILKELDTAGVEKFEDSLKSQENREEGRLNLQKDREEEIIDRLAGLEPLLLDNGKRIYETEHGCRQLEAEEEALGIWKKRGGELLLKYEIPAVHLYDKERVKEALEAKIRQQEGSRYQLLLDEKQMTDMLHGIENHCVYMPEILLKSMEKMDIDCQTGEAYLGNLDEEKRRLQLHKNPLLPFGLIVRGTEKKRLEEVCFGDCFLRQAIPIFTYGQLDHEYAAARQIVDIGEQFGIISSYEERIFGDAARAEYVKQLKKKREEIQGFIRHREAELGQMREADAFFRESVYDRDSQEELGRRMEAIRDSLVKLEQEKKDWEGERETLKQERQQNRAIQENAENALEKIRKNKAVLKEYLERNEVYQDHYRQLGTIRETLQKTAMEIERIRREISAGSEQMMEKRDFLRSAGYRLRQEREIMARYQDAKPATLLTDSFSSMEQEYQRLTASFSDSLAALAKELEEQKQEYEKQKEELSELKAREEDYVDLVYSREETAAKRAEVMRLEEAEETCYGELSALNKQLGDAMGRQKSAAHDLKELGLLEPLAKAGIKQDYERRRIDAAARLKGLTDRRQEVEGLQSACLGIAGRIEDMDVPLVPGQDFELAEDRKTQFETLKKALKQAKASVSLARKSSSVLYRNVSQEFKGKNQCVTDILESLDTLRLEDGNLTYESVYFSMEEFIKKRESLVKLLDFYNGQLESIVHTKNQIVDQCISYARMIYEDVKLIVRKSRVQLSGKSRPVQMLKVGIPEELDSGVKLRMTQYIDESLRILTELGKSEDMPEKKWKEKLSLFMSSRALFNQLIGTNKIPVYVYKIDLSDKGSGLKRWEEAMIQNSGGEKVVAFFTMISTLISYVRDVTGQNGGAVRQESKVLIMDNPFGRTSSEHLLKAIMDIARTFKIQLICLSDLSQSSITNRFSLIYQLSIRKRMYSDKEVLKSGPVHINKAGLEKNERLEHAGVYESQGQRSLWEFMKDV